VPCCSSSLSYHLHLIPIRVADVYLNRERPAYFEFDSPASNRVPLGFRNTTEPTPVKYPDLLNNEFLAKTAAERGRYAALAIDDCFAAQADDTGWIVGHKGLFDHHHKGLIDVGKELGALHLTAHMDGNFGTLMPRRWCVIQVTCGEGRTVVPSMGIW
jgi:hypothetical protein